MIWFYVRDHGRLQLTKALQHRQSFTLQKLTLGSQSKAIGTVFKEKTVKLLFKLGYVLPHSLAAHEDFCRCAGII